MPHIDINGLNKEQVRGLSAEISADLSKVIDCPPDWITFSVSSEIFSNGSLVNDTVIIHVEWFDRGREVKDMVVKILTDAVLQSTRAEFAEIETVDIIFVDLDKSNYYENGEHF